MHNMEEIKTNIQPQSIAIVVDHYNIHVDYGLLGLKRKQTAIHDEHEKKYNLIQKLHIHLQIGVET